MSPYRIGSARKRESETSLGRGWWVGVGLDRKSRYFRTQIPLGGRAVKSARELPEKLAAIVFRSRWIIARADSDRDGRDRVRFSGRVAHASRFEAGART